MPAEPSTPAEPPTAERMSAPELAASFSLAAIFMVRMLGLFMILPVFALYAVGYEGYTPALAGIAIGAYGLSQALFQIPLGALSDRFGRHKIITAGLLVFAIGSVVAALSESIYGVILGRVLQGSGAVAAAILALAADLTRESQRTKAMAIIGVCIGLSFALALVLGPIISAASGLAGVFWTTALLAMVAIAILHLCVERVPSARGTHPRPSWSQLGHVLGDPALVRLDIGILLLHAAMTSLFMALPIVLRDRVGLAAESQWQLYLTVLPVSVLLMAPFARRADSRGGAHIVLASIAVLAISLAGLLLGPQALIWVGLCLTVYFAAFNLLEANLPAQVSRVAPTHLKGTALGVFATSQYLGVFVGGALGGIVLGRYGEQAVMTGALAATVLWVLLQATIPAQRMGQRST